MNTNKFIIYNFIVLMFTCFQINAQNSDVSKKNIEENLYAYYYKDDILGVYRLDYILSDKGLSDTISFIISFENSQINKIRVFKQEELNITIHIQTKTIDQSNNTKNYFLSYSFQNDTLFVDLKLKRLNRIKVNITDENITFKFDNFDGCYIKLSEYVFSLFEFIKSEIIEVKKGDC